MTVTIRTKKLRVNKLLARKELLLEVFHEGKPNVSQAELKQLISTNTNGMRRILYSMVSRQPLEVTDPLDSSFAMIINSIWSNMNLTTDSEELKSYPREILKEKPRNNSRERLRNQEVLKEEKYSPLEKLKLEPILKRLRKNIFKKSLLLELVYE